MEYYETLDLNRKGRMEPSSSLQFTMRDATSEVDSNSVNMIKNESFMDTSAPKFDNEQQCSSKDALTCKKESNEFDVIKIEKTFRQESKSNERNLIGMEDKTFLDQEEIKISTDEQDFNSMEYHETLDLDRKGRREPSSSLQFTITVVTKEVDGNSVNMNKNESNEFDVIKIKELFHQKNESNEGNLVGIEDQKCLVQEEIQIKTDGQDFNSVEDDVDGLKSLLLVHKDPSEVTVYKCDSCSFQTNRKDLLKSHLERHKNPLDVSKLIFKFRTKIKDCLNENVSRHKSPVKVTDYNRAHCSYQTKRKDILKSASLLHKDISEVTIYRCDSCSFHTILKVDLDKHVLTHRDPSEVTKYNCASCSYQTNNKSNLNKHCLIHKDPSEVTKYKCGSCSFQTKFKPSLRKHLQTHMDPLKVTLYKCDFCSFLTRHNASLHRHLLIHNDRSEQKMYKCDSCLFQTAQKAHLELHLLKHKDPSEVTMYKCCLCSFQTKHKGFLRRHSRTHQNSSD